MIVHLVKRLSGVCSKLLPWLRYMSTQRVLVLLCPTTEFSSLEYISYKINKELWGYIMECSSSLSLCWLSSFI